MKKIFFLFIILTLKLYSQGNCLLHLEGSNERKACELGKHAIKLQQGSKQSQILFDSILKFYPKYDWAYKEKSIPFFKRGFVIKGLQILNKAVELKPERHLTYRAYWYFQNRNYKKCIEDLEKYFALPNSYLNELTPGGDMDMRLLLGMSYTKLGRLKKGVSIVEKAIKSYKKIDFGLLDYHILGLLYYKNRQYKRAIKAFKKQLQTNDSYMDTYYYLGKSYKKIGFFEKANNKFKKAIEIYKNPYRMKNGYLCFRVYKTDILRELEDN